eukprot:847545-Pleurochrysis_carterae.AAC.1
MLGDGACCWTARRARARVVRASTAPPLAHLIGRQMGVMGERGRRVLGGGACYWAARRAYARVARARQTPPLASLLAGWWAWASDAARAGRWSLSG